MAQAADLSATIDGRRVDIHRAGEVIATGRWTGRGIEGCPEWLASTAIFRELERCLVEEEVASVAAVEAATRAAYNEDGVDLSLIDWMLSLTPRARLAVLQDAVDSLARFRADVDAVS